MALYSNLPSGGGSMSEKHTNREMKFDYQTKLKGTVEVLSLNGKGRLYNCWFRDNFSGPSNNVQLQIVVDGKMILNIKNINNASSSLVKMITVGSIDWIKYKKDGVMGLVSSTELWEIAYSPVFVGLSADLQTKSSSSDDNIWVLVEDYISFNESVVITATTSGSNGMFSAMYSLDE